MVSTFMRINCPITSAAIPVDMRPSLHKGDVGDFTPVEEVERIHYTAQSSPPQ